MLGKIWRQEEKQITEDEIVGWYHRLNGQEFEQALGDSEGQGSLVCYSPWGHKESDTTEPLNINQQKTFWTCKVIQTHLVFPVPVNQPTISSESQFLLLENCVRKEIWVLFAVLIALGCHCFQTPSASRARTYIYILSDRWIYTYLWTFLGEGSGTPL